MTDPVNPPATDVSVLPSADPVATDPAAPQKSPLDLLEEILGDPKNAAATSAPEASGVPLPPPAPPGPTLEEVEALEAQQAIADQAAAQAKLQEIHQEVQGVKHQEQLTKEATTQQDQSDKTDAQAGFEINQIGHAKI